MSQLLSPAVFTSNVLPIRQTADTDLVHVLRETRTVDGSRLLNLADLSPLLLVFLAPFGSALCREALQSVAKALPTLQARGVQPVFVHMATPERATRVLARYGFGTAEHIADPGRDLYRSPEFRLHRSARLNLLARLTGAKPLEASEFGEDPAQLPGVFFLKYRTIQRAFRHGMHGERPDYAVFGA